MNAHLPPDLLSALVDGEVGPDERRAAHAHLQDCPSCRTTLTEYSAVRRMLGDLSRMHAPEPLVAAALHPPRGLAVALRRATRGPRRYLVAAAATVALGVTVGGIAAPADESPPVDVLVTRHVGVTVGNSGTGQVIFAVTGR